jgi:hypothetical protein
MGASILIPVAARLSAISSDNPVILDIFTPAAGCNSYLVTDGPLQAPMHLVCTPKLLSTSTIVVAFSSSSFLSLSMSKRVSRFLKDTF